MSATRYRAPPTSDLRVADLEEIVAIFHRASGITHLVAPPVPELLVTMAGRWMTIEDLEQEFVLVDGDRAGLVAILENLEVAGLIERA